MGDRLLTALTHGDFQPGNMLVDGNKVWLIDWEYSGRRQVGYDALVYALRSRFPDGLAARMGQMLDGSGAMESLPLSLGLDWQDAAHRRAHLWLFLLEELALHLAENANPRFNRLSEGLATLQQEITDIKRTGKGNS